MSQSPTTTRASLGGKLGALLFSGLFALGFGMGGLWAGVLPLVQTFGIAWSVRSWEPVQARVLATDLASSRGSKGGTTYGVSARYAYEWQGATYESQRVGLTPPDRKDNVGDWHQRWHRELSSAMARESTVQVWVDPSQPSRAVIDKGIRWAMVVFHIPFAFLFTAVGIVAGWVFVSVLLDRPAPIGFRRRGAPDSKPDAVASASSTQGIRSSARGRQIAWWAFAAFWNLLMIPMTVIMWVSGAPILVWLMVAVFDIVGAGLLWVALRASRQAWRYAGAQLTMQPSPAVAGSEVRVSFALRPRALKAPLPTAALSPRVHLRLAQYRIDDSGSSSTSRRVEDLEQHVTPTHMADGLYGVAASFDVPGDAAPSGATRDRERVAWKLEVLDDEGAVEVDFDVDVVQPAGAAVAVDRHSRSASSAPVEIEQWPASKPLPALPASMRVSEADGGWHVHFARASVRAWGLVIGAVAVGLAWWAVPPIGMASQAPLRAYFALGGAAALWALALHGITHRWSLSARDDAVVVDRGSWLWGKARVLAHEDVQRLAHKLSYRAGSGAAMVDYRALVAQPAQGASRTQKLTPAFAGADTAQRVAHHLRHAIEHRRGRFAPGEVRSRASGAGAVGARVLQRVSGWALWAAGVGLVVSAFRQVTGG